MTNPDYNIPDYFNPDDWSTPSEETHYRQRPIGQWIRTQLELGRMVIPKIAKAVPTRGGEHMVMWAERIDVENGLCSICHQIVCDCVMDMPIEDVDSGRFSCKAVMDFLKWGAGEIRHQKKLDNMLAFYSNIPAALPVKKDRKERPGDQVLETLITDLLTETTKHPENWVGNMVSGTHNVRGLSLVFNQEPRTTLRVIEGMQQQQVVELVEDEVVRLRAA